MEKINLVELLKDCPQGMELDCTMFEQPVKYIGLAKSGTYIIIIKAASGEVFYLTKEGYLYDIASSKCIIFPKGKTTWEGFVPPCKFKVGDRIRHIVGREEFATVVSVEELHYNLDSKVGTSSFSISLQHEWELAPNKFDINTLTPFESRVLVRDYHDDRWRASFWGCLINSEYNLIYDTIRGCYKQCIPYEGNERLLGTTNDCNEFYKTWKYESNR